ncbi:MAG: hypothetical protein RMJ34_05840 [candidate division WOR-3 bacterium]|nr:hypothetical protein [candidate division WOR-3 bacterium]MDW8114437.1 hypothetical protein [candidate division WOR-3 bacterium]
MPFKRIFIIILVFLSCKKIGIEENWERKIYAFSILNPKEYYITCIVDSNYSIEKEVKTYGITEAKVFIVNEETKETLNLRHYWNGIYQETNLRWPNLDFFVKPLNTYSLWVIFQNDTLTKKTIVPDTFSITFPKNNDTLHYDSLNYFNWERSRGAVAYALFIFRLPRDTLAEYFPLFTQDTFLDIREIKEALFDTTSYYQLRVYAFDYNRYQWTIKRGELDTLYHGLGHFSSQTNDEIIIFVRKD